MRVGTKSILIGVHAAWFHPLTVILAWRRIYGRWPSKVEWIAILFHDAGYWGCENMDGPEGKRHPYKSACFAVRICKFFRASPQTMHDVGALICGHSRSYAAATGVSISKLCAADKLSILYDPRWFYWLRGILSGEIFEYRDREEIRRGRSIPSTWEWLKGYRRSVKIRFADSLK